MKTQTTTTVWMEEAEDCLRRIAAGEPDLQARARLLADARPPGIEPSVAQVVALRQVFAHNSEQADLCCGNAFSDPDEPAPVGPEASEDYGAAQAWDAAASMVAKLIGEPAGEPFNSSAALELAEALLRSVVADSDEHEIVHTIASDALTVLAELTEEGAPAVDQLDLARRAIDYALDGRQASAASATGFKAVQPNGLGSMTVDARGIHRLVNDLYGFVRGQR